MGTSATLLTVYIQKQSNRLCFDVFVLSVDESASV